MKKKLFVFGLSLFVFLLASSANVYAECTSNRCTGEIERLYISGSTLYISTDGDETFLNCTSPAGVYVSISTENPNFKNYYAMMLTSMSAGNSIGLRVVEGSSKCDLSYVYMDKNTN